MGYGSLNCAELACDDLRIGAADLDAIQRALAGIGFDSWRGGAADGARADVDDLRRSALVALEDVEAAIDAVRIQGDAIDVAATDLNSCGFGGLGLAGIPSAWGEYS